MAEVGLAPRVIWLIAVSPLEFRSTIVLAVADAVAVVWLFRTVNVLLFPSIVLLVIV
jgi:hypothetical protein